MCLGIGWGNKQLDQHLFSAHLFRQLQLPFIKASDSLARGSKASSIAHLLLAAASG